MNLRLSTVVVSMSLTLALFAGAATAAEKHLTYEDLLAYVTDLDRLPVIEPGVYCKQFSSYDRASKYDAAADKYLNWDANGDCGQYLRVDEKTGEGVMAEMEGPGCIFRIWSANPTGTIRFYLDGDSKPTHEWDFMKLTTGAIEPFITPLVWKRDPNQRQSGSNIYLPIPFAKSCKVTTVETAADGKTKPPHHYYIIDYRVFPKDWKVDSFKLPLASAQMDAVRQAARRWADSGNIGLMPLDSYDTNELEAKPGETVTLSELQGPAVIRQFRLKLDAKEKWAGRKVLLKIYFDGHDKPAVWSPFNDFFGDPLGSPYKSYPMGIIDSFNYCFFPMPFHKSAKVVVTNEGTEPVKVKAAITYRRQDVPDDWGLFHAKWRTELASTSFDYPLIKATGTGKLVGIAVFPHNHHGGWWGEGDEKVYVDGEKFPSWFGTGSEDYFGDAWGIRTFHNPSHGFPQPREGSEAKELFANYRWHLGDSIPFYKSFFMTIENYTGKPGAHTRNDYSSVAYWYQLPQLPQLPGGSDFFTETPVEDRIPRSHVVAGAVEAEQYVTKDQLASGMSIVTSLGLPQELSCNRGIKLVGKVGDKFTLNVPADVDDIHVVRLGRAREVKSSACELLIDGQKIGERVQLHKGLNPITVRFTGEPVEPDRCELIVDYFLVEVYRNLITDWMVIGPFPNPDHKGYETPYPPEKEIALAKTYKGRGDADVGWKRVSRPDGLIGLNDMFKPRENLVLYGACVVNAPKPSKRTMLVGSDDGVKVWLNGKLVWQNPVQRAAVPDSDRVEVELAQGPNTVLIKVEQGMGDVGFCLRFLDPADELTYALPQ